MKVTFNAAELDVLAADLESVSAQRIGVRASEVVNRVITRFNDTQQAAQIADINLEPAYVRSKTDLRLAAPSANPRAEIVTHGPGRNGLTILGRYNPLVQVRKQPKRAGSQGAPDGVAVQLRRSGATYQPKWFTMRLRRGVQAGAETGVFLRERGSGKLKHIYGPSPYSLFRYQRDTRADELTDDLARDAQQSLAQLLQEAL